MVRTRRLIFAAAVCYALAMTGCATTPPAATTIPGHQDPEIWRLINPHYPLPE